MPTTLVMKEWIVTFDETGEPVSAKDVTNPNNPPRPRILPVRATTMAKAMEAAKRLYSLSK